MTDFIGGGAPEEVRIVTHGKLRQRHSGTDAHVFHAIATADAVCTGDPGLYFRTSGGKQQLCVVFASGAVQILATEP